MTPAEMFAQLADVGGYLDGARERVKEAAVEDWPSKAHPENIYATNDSVGRFISAVEPDRVVVTNEADHGIYANDGTTRAGPGTANPYRQRGATPYLEQTAERIVEGEAQGLLDHLTGAR
jgi:hypothetical protein